MKSRLVGGALLSELVDRLSISKFVTEFVGRKSFIVRLYGTDIRMCKSKRRPKISGRRYALRRRQTRSAIFYQASSFEILTSMPASTNHKSASIFMVGARRAVPLRIYGNLSLCNKGQASLAPTAYLLTDIGIRRCLLHCIANCHCYCQCQLQLPPNITSTLGEQPIAPTTHTSPLSAFSAPFQRPSR